MIEFENRAWKGFRLVAKAGNSCTLEVSPHYTYSEGHIMLEIERPSRSGDGTHVAEPHFFKDFASLKQYLEERFGSSNIDEFRAVIEATVEEMLRDPQVRKWKGLTMSRAGRKR